jgi:DNA-binding transcriptional regulator YhcF (GntR family)
MTEGAVLMHIRIDPRSSLSISDQIATGIRHAIEIKDMEAGESLPSIHDITLELRVAPTFVREALKKLEAEGLIASTAGAEPYTVR